LSADRVQANFFAAKLTIPSSEVLQTLNFAKSCKPQSGVDGLYDWGFCFGSSPGALSAGASSTFGTVIFCLSSTPNSR
jgi:hypothetical protein